MFVCYKEMVQYIKTHKNQKLDTPTLLLCLIEISHAHP